MTTPTEHDLEILIAPPALRRVALEMILHEVPAERRDNHIESLLVAARGGSVDLAGLLIARQGGQIVGAVWAYCQPGHVASLWAPVAYGSAAEAIVDALLASTQNSLARGGTRLVQCLLPMNGTAQAAQLQRNGFMHMADLLYMVSLGTQFPLTPPGSKLQIQPVRPGEEARLAAIIARTYERTLDCPQLNGVRDMQDVLAGYRACGTFDPARWFIAQCDGQDVGCLLLTDHPAEDQWEVVYAGLVPEERGHRYGLALARYAQWLTRQASRARLVLAVDAANAPAVKMYESAGFVIWDRRQALLQILPHGGVASRASIEHRRDAVSEKSAAKCQ